MKCFLFLKPWRSVKHCPLLDTYWIASWRSWKDRHSWAHGWLPENSWNARGSQRPDASRCVQILLDSAEVLSSQRVVTRWKSAFAHHFQGCLWWRWPWYAKLGPDSDSPGKFLKKLLLRLLTALCCCGQRQVFVISCRVQTIPNTHLTWISHPRSYSFRRDKESSESNIILTLQNSNSCRSFFVGTNFCGSLASSDLPRTRAARWWTQWSLWAET